MAFGFDIWKGITTMCKCEYIVQGHQHEGMSGGPVANGYGYLGMSHSMVKTGKFTRFAVVVDAITIHDFIYVNMGKLTVTMHDCQVDVLVMPVMSKRSFTDMHP